jgi:hypothetical protein
LASREEKIILTISELLDEHENEFILYETVDHLNIGIHCLSIHFNNANGRVLKGFGASFIKNMAFIKAWAELVERYYLINDAEFSINALNSNGFAAHIQTKLAKQNAVNELIERDVLMNSWLLKIPAKKIEIPNFDIYSNIKTNEILKKINEHGFKVTLGILGICNKAIVGISMVEEQIQKNLGAAIFTCANKCLDTVMSSLLIDSIFCINSLVGNKMQYKFTTQNEVHKFIDHHNYYIQPTKKKDLMWIIDDKKNNITQYPKISKIKFKKPRTKWQFKGPFKVRRAISSNAQNIWTGITEVSKINFNRLSEITGYSVKKTDLNFNLHPLA